MLAELVEKLFDVHEKSMDVNSKRVGHFVAEQLAGKETTYRLAIPATPHRRIERLQDFALYVKTRAKDKALTKPSGITLTDSPDAVYSVPAEGSVVFFNEKAVTYYEAPHDARGIIAEMPLQQTPEFQLLSKPMSMMDPLEFNRFLRITLRGMLVDPTVPARLAKLKFENNETTTATAGSSRGGFGKEVNASLSIEEQPVPENIRIKLRPFVNIDKTYEVDFALEADFRQAKMKLTAYPSEMVAVVESALMTIPVILDGVVPSYFGCAPGTAVVGK